MDPEEINKILLAIRDNELIFAATKSGGPGGQHVNKVSTKVEVRFNIGKSEYLTDSQKEMLFAKLTGKLTKESELIVTSQKTRSQQENKYLAIEKCLDVLQKALTPPKKRKPTKPGKASKEKRLEEKKKQSEKKELRKPPDI